MVYLESHCLSSESSDKNLHSSPKSQYKMESRFFCDVVISKSSLVLEVLSCEDKSLLARRDSLLVLYFGFDCLDAVILSGVESHGLSCESSYVDLLHGCVLIIDES